MLQLRHVFQTATQAMMNRGLSDSAVWASSLLAGANEEAVAERFQQHCSEHPPRGFVYATDHLEADESHPDTLGSVASPSLMLGRALFARQEYRRCINALRGETSDEAVFLQHYAWYLDGERQNTLGIDSSGESSSTGGLSTFEGSCAPSDVSGSLRRNPVLPEIFRALGAIVVTSDDDGHSPAPPGATPPQHAHHDATRLSFHNDPYLVWLYGLVASKSGLPDVAIQAFACAVSMEPLLWAAWRDMVPLVRYEGQLADISQALLRECAAVPWVVSLFAATARVQLGQLASAMSDVDDAAVYFPQAAFIQQLRAQVHSAAKEHEQAKNAFLQLRTIDGYRLGRLLERPFRARRPPRPEQPRPRLFHGRSVPG
jgi:anaphase-promoting complex subunit 8